LRWQTLKLIETRQKLLPYTFLVLAPGLIWLNRFRFTSRTKKLAVMSGLYYKNMTIVN